MIKNSLLLCIHIFCLMLGFINHSYSDKNTEVELITNCGKTKGVIFYCAERMAEIEHHFERASYYKN